MSDVYCDACAAEAVRDVDDAERARAIARGRWLLGACAPHLAMCLCPTVCGAAVMLRDTVQALLELAREEL